jgi:hypothetical protein
VLLVTARSEPYQAQVRGKYKYEIKVEKPGKLYWEARLADKQYAFVRVFNSNIYNLADAWALYRWGSPSGVATCIRTQVTRTLWHFKDGSRLTCPAGHIIWTIPLGDLICRHNKGDSVTIQ